LLSGLSVLSPNCHTPACDQRIWINAINGVELLELATIKFETGQLGPKAIQKISGKAWDQLRLNFLVVCGHLLDVSPNTHGELTTSYVKFTIGNSHLSRVYAALWVKNSRSFTVGLALPDECKHPLFTDALKGMSYKGLTKYVTITPEDTIPDPCSQWAELAYKLILGELAVGVNGQEVLR